MEHIKLLTIPTVDDWFALTLRYREFHRVSNTVLKDYGYMAIMDYLDTHDCQNILEFGHGFNATLFERYRDRRNVWGLDDYQGLSYFDTPDRAAWDRRFENEIRARAPNCTYRRGLMGAESVDLPESYFDVICSVSVLEEVRIEEFPAILKHAARLLKPGGVLIGTHDLSTAIAERIGNYIVAHVEAGLDLGSRIQAVQVDNKTLLENPTVAMLWYQGREGEDRKYRGHFATVWTVATKRSDGLSLPARNTGDRTALGTERKPQSMAAALWASRRFLPSVFSVRRALRRADFSGGFR